MVVEVIDRGRGPEIRPRITVYNVMDYYLRGRHPDFIASVLRLTSEEVTVAIRYIDEHRDELMPKYQRGVDRANQGNPPELEAKLVKSREKIQALKIELEQRRVGSGGAADARVAG